MDAAFSGPYVAAGITFRNPPAAVRPVVPAILGPTETGPGFAYDPAGTDHAPSNGGAPAQPTAPNRWRTGRDPYANSGMIGQPQFLPAT